MWQETASFIRIMQSSQNPNQPNRLPPPRSILSAIGTCSYNLAKFFVPILKEFTINEYTVKDSFPFSNEIRNKRMRQLTFVWNCYLIKREKLKECFKNM